MILLSGAYRHRAAKGTRASRSRWASEGNSASSCLSSCSWRLSSPEPRRQNKCLTVGGKAEGRGEETRSIRRHNKQAEMLEDYCEENGDKRGANPDYLFPSPLTYILKTKSQWNTSFIKMKFAYAGWGHCASAQSYWPARQPTVAPGPLLCTQGCR